MTMAMWTLSVLTVAFGLAGARMAIRDFSKGEILSWPSVAIVWFGYLLAIGTALLASWTHIGEVPITRTTGLLLGAPLTSIGVIVVALGSARFQDIPQLSGRKQGQLVTSGVYRWSRNPQNVGLFVSFVGIGVAGRSTLTLLLTGVLAAIFRLYVPHEEAHLTRTFGPAYERYRQQTARWLGIPAIQ